MPVSVNGSSSKSQFHRQTFLSHYLHVKIIALVILPGLTADASCKSRLYLSYYKNAKTGIFVSKLVNFSSNDMSYFQ